jgi:hypothetical protein
VKERNKKLMGEERKGQREENKQSLKNFNDEKQS